MNKSNILLVTEQDNIEKIILSKIILLRCNDCVTTCTYKNIKKTLENSVFSVVILHEDEIEEYTLKTIKNIKDYQNDIDVILLLNRHNPELVLKAYDNGMFDYLTLDSNECDYLIKIVNCFKKQGLIDINSRNEKFLYQQGVIDNKTNLYNYKHLKEIFNDLTENLRVQHGIFAIVTLDESTKTKISTNRLAQTIKNSLRCNDIIATGKGGKFYIIIPDIDILGTSNLINKIQEKMGNESIIRAGLSKIETNSFDTILKNAQDSLTSAIQNDTISACIENSLSNSINNWLEDDEKTSVKKDFKLFKKIFTNKMENVITPIFYRHQKEFETKLTNTQVSQYVNEIESVFCLKNEMAHSELTLRYNGYAKFKIDIIHKGLYSPENTSVEIPINELTEKYLKTLFKKLREEYKQSAYKKEN